MTENKTALVTGATGFTGSVVVRQLLENGFKVRAIARQSSSLKPFEGMTIEWIRGDVFEDEVIEKAVQGVSFIFHLATAYRDAGQPDEVYDRVDLGGTKKLAAAAVKQPGLERFVHVSTCGVHGHVETPPADEEYRMKPDDIYQRKKAEAEIWIREFAKKKGLPLTVVRPAGIYGPGDARLLKLFKLALGAFFPLFGHSKGLYHLIHVEDLAAFMIAAAQIPAAQGEVFLCGNPVYIPLKDIVKMIAAPENHEPRFVKIPAGPVFFLAGLCEAVCRPLKIKPPIFRRRIAFFTKDRAFDTRKMTRLTGFVPAYSYEEGLRQTLAWYFEKGWLKPRKAPEEQRKVVMQS
jgi:nucleoside-diphosphate-sugar epimerase